MEQAAQETAAEPRRRRRRRSSRMRSRQKLRLVYFALASIWGFISGSAGILIFMASTGTPVRFGALAAATLAAAGAVAIVGGFIAARAYREASQRS